MSEDIQVTYCPKCDSENVVTRELRIPPVKIIRKSMDDLGQKRTKRVNRGRVRKFKNFKAICFECGYVKEWEI